MIDKTRERMYNAMHTNYINFPGGIVMKKKRDLFLELNIENLTENNDAPFNVDIQKIKRLSCHFVSQ